MPFDLIGSLVQAPAPTRYQQNDPTGVHGQLVDGLLRLWP